MQPLWNHQQIHASLHPALVFKKTLVYSIGILIEEGQLVKCGNIPYSGKSVPELSIILQVLTVHFLLVRHFVPKVFSTELW